MTPVARVCENCGEEFTTGRPTQRFCSPRCQVLAERRRAARRKRGALPPPPPRQMACGGCGKQETHPVRRGPPRKKCRACRMADARARNARNRPGPQSRVCPQCGSAFANVHMAGARRWCSKACRSIWVRENRGANPYGAQSRAKKRGVPWERFFPVEILERDGWTCQACGALTPRELRGTTDPKAPEVDHVIPLGPGPHTRANSQCLCRACNMKKGRKLW